MSNPTPSCPSRHPVQVPSLSPSAIPIHRHEFFVPESALDENGHVNNVQYLQWMQEAAIRHYDAMGGTAPTKALGASWVVRSHHVEYLHPAFAGDGVEVRTWVVNIRRVRSLRRYRFTRPQDGKLLVRGETEWVFVDSQSGAPRPVPKEISHLFQLLPEGTEP